jgi:DNA-binding NtrC family response regulator
MNSYDATILIIEDDQAIAASLAKALGGEGYEPHIENRGDTGLEAALRENYDVVVVDLKLPGIEGMELVEKLHAAKPLTPVILMTAFGNTAIAIEATKQGAFDYVVKPFQISNFLEIISKAVTTRRKSADRIVMREPIVGEQSLVGESPAMLEIYKEIGRLARTPLTVLIQGETGSGKELVARAIYQHSDRADKPFLSVNCAAIPETLLESELFGHERGSFTGADARRIGRFEQADKGTLFLDEIGEMTPGTQAKLLRVLQDQSFQRLGGKETISVDVRVIAATNRDLAQAVQDGRFREDLYYRLSVAVIKIAPLRQRREDLAILVSYFLKRYGGELGFPEASITSGAMLKLEGLSWPGNVRQLENVVRKAILLSRGFPINETHVEEAVGSSSLVAEDQSSISHFVAELLDRVVKGQGSNVIEPLFERVEKELYTQAFKAAQGNQVRAARWVGVSRPTIREKFVKYALITEKPERGRPRKHRVI